MSASHGGNLNRLAVQAGCEPNAILDFSANLNPLGPPEWTRAVLRGALDSLRHYPDPDCSALLAAAAEHYACPEANIVAGNGSSELLHQLLPLLDVQRAVIPVPSYVDYTAAARHAGLAVKAMMLRADAGFVPLLAEIESELDARPTVVMLGQPNNPTGKCFDAEELRAVAARHPRDWFVVDEAFADFVPGLDRLTARRPPNVMVLLSQTKNYALPGLRLGLGVADAEMARRWRAALAPWSVNTLAQAVGARALLDAAYLDETRRRVREWRVALVSGLRRHAGLTVTEGEANFVLVRLNVSAAPLAARLLRRGIAVRECSNFAGLDDRYIRLAVRTPEENEKLLDALDEELSGAPAVVRRRPTPALMFQGTTSNAGKSVLTAAFCRILLEDGYSVAPFKAQNMSLNSYVTRDGLEMGRAQVVQAQACRLDADVRMNPILLKPNSDTGSQVILRGRPVGNMEALDYFSYKARAWDEVRACYNSLSAEHDAMVLEGAGSPAEINLKRHDIVNMSMAMHAHAPVALVGDIDRGGVFAAFVGCMEVFTERERAQVAGFVVNRFRGKESLLGDAMELTLRHTGRPVLGVVPYLADLGLPEEDSVGFKEGVFDDNGDVDGRLDVAVIDLPHISNFTDFDALRIEPDVRLRVVRTAEELGRPAALILPGSKNVPGDLRFLRETGLARAIEALARERSCEVVGVCGGFQMLGERIADPHHLESDGRAVATLGLLPVETTLEAEKTLRRTTARHLESGLTVRGYEIHHGLTRGDAALAVLDPAGGARSADGLVWGCYVHGLFDEDAFRRWYLDRLRLRAGLTPLDQVVARYDIEPALERLAVVVRERLPIAELYRRMGLR